MLAIGDDELRAALNRVVQTKGHTRERVLLDELLHVTFERLRTFASEQPLLSIGYSFKTNPRASIVREARRCGFYAECISPGEVENARENGFAPDRIIYNGPKPASTLTIQPKIAFADSVEAYRRICADLPNTLCGVRLRPAGIASRFGVPMNRFGDLTAAIRECGRNELGVSFQVRAEDYGAYDFRGLVDTVSETAARIAAETGVTIVVFDVGAGRSPQQFDAAAENGDFTYAAKVVQARLPGVREIVAEPGQEVDTSLEAVIAPVLEARPTPEGPEIIVDAGYPDFPEIGKFAHRLFLLREGRATQLKGGPGSILGRTCLEFDRIATNVCLPRDVGTNDAIVICDVGSYDASMEFAFAQGLRSGNTAP